MLRAMFIKPESQSHQTTQSVLKLAVSSGPLPTNIGPMANLKRRQESPTSGSDSTPPAHHHFQTQLPLTNTFLSSQVPPLFEYSTPDQQILSPEQQQQLQHQEQQVLQQQPSLRLPSTVSGTSATPASHHYQERQSYPQSRIPRHALSPPARQRQGHPHRNKRTRTAAPMSGHQDYGNSSGQPPYNMYATTSSTYSGGPYTATTLGSSYPPVTGNPGAGGNIGLVTEPPVSAPSILQPQMPHYQPYPPQELPPSQVPSFQIDEIESLDEQRRQRRRFQNRDAQKNFRERQKKEQQELVSRVTRLESELQNRDADMTVMRAQLDRAQQENEQLRRQLIMRSSDSLSSGYNARSRREGEGAGDGDGEEGHDDE